MDSVSEARLASVNPLLAQKIRTLSDMMAQQNIAFRVTQGLRTWDEQATLFAQGRTAPGNKVTNAPPGYSYHQFGLAVDIVPMDQDPPQPDWNISHPVWQAIITAAESLGLVSGSCFVSIKDFPHLQLTGTLPESPDNNVRQAYLTGGVNNVWQVAGLNEETTTKILFSKV